MIRTTLKVALTLMLGVLIRLARMQSAEHLIVSVKAARRGCEKKQIAGKRTSMAWKLRSSAWELRFCRRRQRLTQRLGPPIGGSKGR